jgi:hypothetical protein
VLLERLGKNGRDYGSTVPSREVLVFRTPTGGLVVAEKRSGSAGPPSEEETKRLREAVEQLVARD